MTRVFQVVQLFSRSFGTLRQAAAIPDDVRLGLFALLRYLPRFFGHDVIAGVQQLLAFCDVYVLRPEWSLTAHAHFLAINWFGGCEIGARVLVDHVALLVAAMNAIKEDQRVTLLLTIANLSAYLSEDEDALQTLLDNGIAAPLIACAQSGNIRSGSVGSLMGLLNLRAHIRPEVGFRVAQSMVDQLIQCFFFSLEGQPQENIL